MLICTGLGNQILRNCGKGMKCSPTKFTIGERYQRLVRWRASPVSAEWCHERSVRVPGDLMGPFWVQCHHKNATVSFKMQNIFLSGKCVRTIIAQMPSRVKLLQCYSLADTKQTRCDITFMDGVHTKGVSTPSCFFSTFMFHSPIFLLLDFGSGLRNRYCGVTAVWKYSSTRRSVTSPAGNAFSVWNGSGSF